jgi:arylsulfatase A-like enzyme
VTVWCLLFMSYREGLNVLFVVMDTVRKDRLSVYGHDRSTTPVLNDLADDATVFTQAVSPAPWTLPVHASLFTGLYPCQHNARQQTPHLKGAPTLAEMLSQAGYSTGCFSANPWVSPYTGLTDDFDAEEYFFKGAPDGSLVYPLARLWNSLVGSNSLQTVLEPFMTIGSGAYEWLLSKKGGTSNTPDIVDRTIEFVDDTSGPFFAFLNLMDAHLPYHPPDRYAEQFAAGADPTTVCQNPNEYNVGARTIDDPEWENIRGLYDGAIRTMDTELSRLFSWLSEENYWEDTVVVVCSDHGELHGEHGLYGHEFNVYDPTVNVPLLVKHPDLAPGTYDDQMELLDLFYTLLDSAGLEAPSNTSYSTDERSLLSPEYRTFENGEYAFIQYGKPVIEMIELKREASDDTETLDDDSRFVSEIQAVRHADGKYIHNESMPDEFYELDADPGEQRDRHDQETPLEGSLATALSTFLSRSCDGAGGSRQREEILDNMESSARDHLRELGYM